MDIEKKHEKVSFGESFKKTSIMVFVLMILNVIWNLVLHPERFTEMTRAMGGASQPMWQLMLITIATIVVVWLLISLIFSVIYFLYRNVKAN